MLILCQKFIQLGVPASHGAGQAHDHDHPWSVILLYGQLVTPGWNQKASKTCLRAHAV